jgi:gliding motility-associated-like protein
MNTINPGANGGFTTLTRNTWLFANPGDPYIMTVMRPLTPTISCPGPLCSNNTITSFSANSTDPTVTTYNWTNPTGSTINSGQGTSTVNVDWGTANGYIYVYAVNAQGCQSQFADSCTTVINQAPNAGFTSNVNPSNPFNYTFNDVTLPTITNWAWNFGDGGTSNIQTPNYSYSGPGTYNVQLIVTNAAGCLDTVMATVIVDYNEGVVIPNIFSPNGDGINDSFFITHNGFKDFHIDIFNRWGQKLYSSDAANFAWDGKDTNGQYVSDGTYYFILKGTSLGGKEYDEHGSVYAFVK